MADWALFVGFGFPARGRERQAPQVFNEFVEHFAGLQGSGEVEGFDAFFLEPHGGDLGGFFLLRGDREALQRVQASEEFERLTLRAQLTIENFGVVMAATGETIGRFVGMFEEAAGELAG